MAKQSEKQKETVERVMHEFKHAELESHGRKVKSPKQAIAIGLSEAGASNQQSEGQNRRALKHTEAKERKGETAMQQKEGKHAPERKRAAGARKAKSSRSAADHDGGERTKSELYTMAKRQDVPGRSKMSKDDLAPAVHA